MRKENSPTNSVIDSANQVVFQTVIREIQKEYTHGNYLKMRELQEWYGETGVIETANQVVHNTIFNEVRSAHKNREPERIEKALRWYVGPDLQTDKIERLSAMVDREIPR